MSKILKSKTLPFTSLIMAVISAVMFRSSKSNWVFIDQTIGFEDFSIMLLTLMIITALLLGILSALRLNSEKAYTKKFFSILLIIGTTLSIIFFIFSLAYSAGLIFSESAQVYALNFKKTITEGALLFIVPFLTIFFPALPRNYKKFSATVLLTLSVIFGINTFHPLTPYKITSEPLVIDNGKEYSIVFSTNDRGSAFAEYTYNGKEYKVFDNTGGRLNADKKIHSISVPYEHLRNNTYKVSSTRVIEEFSYGSRRGNTVTSVEYKFTYNDSKDQTWLVISDWHTMCKTAYQAINNFESNFDAVILLGDASPGVDFEEQVIANTVQFGGKVSGGTKPVIYVRGNHETRGAYAKDLPIALGLDQFYYTAESGPYSFVVLDSGEDKDDSHIEYGGMNDYNTYRADMIDWLKDVKIDNDKIITLSHSWKISDVEKELSKEGWAELDRLGTRLLISGHEHKCRFIGDKNDYEKEIKTKYPDIIGYVDGGKKEDDYIASMLVLKENGFTVKAVDNNGNEVINENFKW